jgi:DNA-binding beta-propeller fold protein YncE
MIHTVSGPIVAGVVVALVATALRAQGEVVNFEEPQIKPIAIAQVQNGAASASYVVACNTPDNSIEIHAGAAPHAFVARVAVGLSPVTVRWHAAGARLYVCNFLGDSVSVVHLPTVGSTTNIRPKLERTVHVGDEPVDIAFLPGGTQARVALHGRSQTQVVIIPDLTPVGGPTVLQSPPVTGGVNDAVKAPRALASLADGRFYALNTMGGNNAYDVDLYVEDPNGPQPLPPPPTPVLVFHLVGGMGTTNAGFAVRSDGNAMYVVGGRARNTDPASVGVDAVSQHPFGFVESWLWYVDLTGGGNPQQLAPPPAVAAEYPTAPAGAASINLNREYNGGPTAKVALGERVSQPTDVVLIESAPGTVQHVLVTGFGTDRVLVLSAPGGGGPLANAGFQRTPIDVVVHNAAAGYGASGPRGLAHDVLTNQVWVLNRLDNSLATFSLTGFTPGTPPTVTRLGLNADPTPLAIRAGRPFLYAARQTSGTDNHMVACASCHVDGRTDGLAWNLGHTDTLLPAIPPKLIETALHGTPFDPDPFTDFQNAKGPLVTQTLQGLVNSTIESVETQYVTTNAPYHWRGDKPRFQDFNEAFVRLQGMPNQLALPARAGLTDPQMDAYTAFVHTIHHAPNTEQSLDRRLHGALGDPDDPDDVSIGSGSLFGLKVYHTRASLGARSCSHCHALPEGSNNVLPLDFHGNGGGLLPNNHGNPLESAATRNLFQRERALILPGDFLPTDSNEWTRTASFGLTHDGVAVNTQSTTQAERSINNFVQAFNLLTLQKLALVEFVRGLDSGAAPLIGRAMCVDATHAVDSAMLTLLKEQAEEANVGVAVQTRNQGTVRGYYYDVTATPGVWRQANGATTLTDTALLALVTGGDDVLVFQAVPTGSERRVAHNSGAPLPLTGPAPANVVLLPMVPNTVWVGITQLTALWDPQHPTVPFAWGSGDPQPLSLLQIRALQESVRTLNPSSTTQAPAPALLRHEPPRRFRVTGDDIRHGAKLELGLVTQNAGAQPVKRLVLDLAPTKYRHNTKVVWESTEELDPLMTLVFLHGGPEVPAVQQVLDGDRTQLAATFPTPPSPSQAVNPATWNLVLVNVANADGTTMPTATWQSLSIADTR